ncbi:hypothetical protein R5R35_002534 [Gryllus longicercus]|uniref:Hikeshi-like domain-containing protein n=1 Tax=Gryllus longicercus TaxID=2509291 RepID=A0AAN9VVQ7_9ORTH|nr:Protein OPI10 homolog [Gryllus bimaculatus]
MFGVLVTGRLVQTDFEQVSPTRCVSTIVDADSINHIVVFLTGIQPFPEGTGGLVYFSWPDENAPPTWQLLGHISNEKPSAIFKISNLKKGSQFSEEMVMFGMQQQSHLARIGISVEPLQEVQQQSANVASEMNNVVHLFGQKMLENFVNYTSSFVVSPAQIIPNANESYIPLSTMQTWYNNFLRKLQQNPNFWRL